MFIKDTEIEVNWFVPATTEAYVASDFYVSVKAPDGSGYTEENAIADDDYIAPTDSTVGGVSYRLTPDQTGVWIIILTVGDPTESEIYQEYFMRVSEPDTHVYQQVDLG